MINEKCKKRIFDIIQIGNKNDLPSRLFDFLIVTVIIVNILVLFLGTFEQFLPYAGFLKFLENVTLLVFFIEYCLRIWTAHYLFPGKRRPIAILCFLSSFDGIIELLTILPFFFLSGFVVFRMLRVVRIFHLFRINTYYDSFNVITSVLYEKRNQLLSSLFIILVLMFASSLCMYSAEHASQPQAFRNAFSGLWWSMSTLLTVGYGDIYPITVIGRIMGIIIAFLGVGVVAIPTGIISAGFVEQYTKAQNSSTSQDINIHTIVIDIDSLWIGLSIADVEQRYGIIIVMVRRGSKVLQPDEDYRIEMQDSLAIYKKSLST